MAWIVGLVLIVGFAWLMTADQSFRRLGFGLIALVVVGIVILWLMERNAHRRFMAEVAREKAAIPLSAVELRDLTLSQDLFDNLAGTVVNHSAHPIRAMIIQVTVRDCPSTTTTEGCTIIGQDDAAVYVDVPPGQARRLGTSVDLSSSARPIGNRSWTYALKEVTAKLD